MEAKYGPKVKRQNGRSDTQTFCIDWLPDSYISKERTERTAISYTGHNNNNNNKTQKIATIRHLDHHPKTFYLLLNQKKRKP